MIRHLNASNLRGNSLQSSGEKAGRLPASAESGAEAKHSHKAGGPSGNCFERARLHRLRKNSIQDGFVTGHGFSRADKANQMSRALAPAKAYSSS
jgi:hypothetical protein